MAHLIKGVTNFLENVDQSYGEHVANRSQQMGSGVDDVAATGGGWGDDDDWNEEPAAADVAAGTATPPAEPAAAATPGAEQPSSSGGGFPRPPSGSSVSDAGPAVGGAASPAEIASTQELQRQVEATRKAQAEQKQRHEAAVKEQSTRYHSLQKDYDTVMDQLRSTDTRLKTIEGEHDELQQELEKQRSAAAALATENEELQKKASGATDTNMTLEQQLLDAQEQLTQQVRETRTIRSQKERADEAAVGAQEELESYKAKTKALLAERDSRIEQLSNGASAANASESIAELQEALKRAETRETTIQSRVTELEKVAESLKEEKLAVQNELTEAVAARDLASAAASSAKQHGAEVKELFEGERSAHMVTKTTLEKMLDEKRDELVQMEKRVLQAERKATEGAGEAHAVEWERKAKELGELVMEKQSALEAKRSEADQWRTRYEVSQQRLREVEMVSSSLAAQRSSSSGPGSRAVSIDDDEVVQGEFDRSQFFGNLQRRGQWGQQVVRVAKRIDTVSLRGGSLLKRSSVLRIALILYVVVLQLWLFFIVSVSSNVPSGSNSGLQEPKV